MTIRLDHLNAKLMRLLDALDPPRGISDQGRIDEAGALLRAVDRAAPKDGYDGWWPRFEDALREGMRGRTWPTPGDVARAAKGIPIPRSAQSQTPEDTDWREAAKVKQVGDWLSGRRHAVTEKLVMPGIPAAFVTYERLAANGVTGAHADRIIAHVADPENGGIGDWRHEERRRRERQWLAAE